MKKGIELLYTIGWVGGLLYVGSLFGVGNALIALGAVVLFYFSQQIYLLIFGNNNTATTNNATINEEEYEVKKLPLRKNKKVPLEEEPEYEDDDVQKHRRHALFDSFNK